MRTLRVRLRSARIGYRDAIAAIPYMPQEAKPYTEQTAAKYKAEIEYIEKLLKSEAK